MLYDDYEKLLECRLLKKDEVVSCGESLTFSAYLIDILDAQEGHKPITDLNSQGRNMKITGEPSLMHRQKFRNRSVSSGITLNLFFKVAYVFAQEGHKAQSYFGVPFSKFFLVFFNFLFSRTYSNFYSYVHKIDRIMRRRRTKHGKLWARHTKSSEVRVLDDSICKVNFL